MRDKEQAQSAIVRLKELQHGANAKRKKEREGERRGGARRFASKLRHFRKKKRLTTVPYEAIALETVV